MNMCSYVCCKDGSDKYKDIESISSFLKMVAEPSRLRILCVLQKKSHCVQELMDHLPMSQSLISHHLSDLKSAGIVADERFGKKIYYSIGAKHLNSVRYLLDL
jgi:ArsR family transcriptional regulator, arsenate/arsenite/antimonite-responsive transcriptional repressor